MGDEIDSKPIEQHFAEWESHAIGFGYGSGEAHTLGALRSFMSIIKDDGQAYNYQDLEMTLTPVVTWLLISILGHSGLLEYGSSTRYGWLTKEGMALRSFMMGKSLEELVAICTDNDSIYCTPSICNCGPNGYSEEKLCHNPFWIEVSENLTKP